MAPDTRLFRKLRFARHKIPAWSASYQINDLRFSAIKGLKLSVRPAHPQSDPAAQAAFKKKLRAQLVAAALPPEARDKPLEIWFQDEARIGQQGTLTRVWARRGTRPRAPRDTRYKWAYIFGAVCPERAAAAALVMPFADTQAMNEPCLSGLHPQPTRARMGANRI